MKGKVIMKALGMVSMLVGMFMVAGCGDVISAIPFAECR